MPGRYQHQIDAANRSSFPKWQWMLDARARQTNPHQACCALRNDHLLVRRDVVTVRVGNERETFCLPWVQPEILLRQVNTALVANFDHAENYFPICVSSIARADADEHCGLRVDTCLKDPLYYGNEICRRTSNFDFLGCFRSREGHSGGTQSRRESHGAAGGIGPKFRVSKNQALLHE